MKRITIILSLIAMMLGSAISYADDVNIFLRNRWDSELENDSDTKTQVLFIADRVVAETPDPCTPEPVELNTECTGDNCYTITVTVDANAKGKVYLADDSEVTSPSDTWSATTGQPGLFKFTPNDGYKAVIDSGCGGFENTNYYITDHNTAEDCTVAISFETGEIESQMCNERPDDAQTCADLGGTWKNETCVFEGENSFITDKTECEARGGLYTGSIQYIDKVVFHNIVVAPDYTGGNESDTKGACVLPAAQSGGGFGQTLKFCKPPIFSSCTADSTGSGIDYRTAIAKVMDSRPDIKYGLYALDGDGATQVFSMTSGDPGGIAAAKTDLNNDAKFPDVSYDEITTLSALSDAYAYLSDSNDSPMLDKCAQTQLVVLTSGGYSGDLDKYQDQNSALVTDTDGFDDAADSSYGDMLKSVASYLNNSDASHDIKPDCSARVNLSVIGINPPEDSELFKSNNSEILAQKMAANGGGVYKKLTLPENFNDEDKKELGTALVNTVLSIVDHSREDETALITPVAPVSITRGSNVDLLYSPAFKAQEQVNWPGNMVIGDSASLPTPSFTNAGVNFGASRTIYTLDNNGAIVVLTKDGDLETDFNQDDLDWLTDLGTGDLSTLSTEQKQQLLGDILHFRPLPIHYGDMDDDPQTIGANDLFVVVGTNRGMLHMFDKDGNEKWAFLPPQLKPMVKALRQQNIAPDYSMVNHFYGVDGAPSVFIYDAGRDGKINPDDTVDILANANDKVLLYFGLRRGGAGYFAMDITDPLDPSALWNIGGSALEYGNAREATIAATEPGENTKNEVVPVDADEEVLSGSSGACNEIILTQGAAISAGTVANQCINTTAVGGIPTSPGSKCGDGTSGSTSMCLYGTCDNVGSPDGSGVGVSTGFGPGHRVLETVTGTYIGSYIASNSKRYPVWTSKRLCVPVIVDGDNSINIKPEAGMQYTSAYASSCYLQGIDQLNLGYMKGKLSVGINSYAESPPGRVSSIIGFNITPIAELLSPVDGSDPKIKITKAVLSMGHTKYGDATNYGSGVNVYAAKGGKYGDHPWQEGGVGGDGSIYALNTKKDCLAMEDIESDTVSLNSGEPVAKIHAPISGLNRTTGGVIESEAILGELFDISNWYVAVNEGRNYSVSSDGIVTLEDGNWTQENVYIQFGLRHNTAVSWGLVRESAAIANKLNEDQYPNGDYYEQVSPNLHVEWCWLDANGQCKDNEPTGPVLTIKQTGDFGTVTAHNITNPDDKTCSTSNCEYTYASGDQIKLTATGDGFESWDGCTASATPNVCTITMGSAKTVTANYAPVGYYLAATTAEAGVVIKASYTSVEGSNYLEPITNGVTANKIKAGSSVTIQVENIPSGKSVTWGDDLEQQCGTDNPCTFTMPDENISGNATFAEAATCFTATNSEHETENRAYSESVDVEGERYCDGTYYSYMDYCYGDWVTPVETTTTWYAEGSNSSLGTDSTASKSLKKDDSGNWNLVGSCN